jgi:RND superfamily putative drug exporter
VTDPLAFTGCGRGSDLRGRVKGSDDDATRRAALAGAAGNGQSMARKRAGGLPSRNGAGRAVRPLHPVTLWRSRLSVALDALETEASVFERRSPVETTHVQLPSGDRLQIPTGAETLRLKGYLIMSRNSSRDYAEFAELVDAMEPEIAAVVLGGMDRYYCCQSSRRQWIATQLVRRLADPHPSDVDDDRWPEPDGKADWEAVRQRCLSVAR